MELSTRSGNSANCVIAAKVSLAKDLIHIKRTKLFFREKKTDIQLLIMQLLGEAKWKVPGYGDRGGREAGVHHHHCHHHHRHHHHRHHNEARCYLSCWFFSTGDVSEQNHVQAPLALSRSVMMMMMMMPMTTLIMITIIKNIVK